FLSKRFNVVWLQRRRGNAQISDPGHFLPRLLRACSERPRRGHSDKRHQLSPLHSITSSARARSDGGMVRPSTLAGLRLVSNSNLSFCWTGRSAGLAPLSILST